MHATDVNNVCLLPSRGSSIHSNHVDNFWVSWAIGHTTLPGPSHLDQSNYNCFAFDIYLFLSVKSFYLF